MRTYSAILTALMLATTLALAQTTPATTPATMPAQTTTAKPTPAATPAMPMGKVAVNTATEAQLAVIPGVGTKLAAAIVKARPYKNSADLIKRVKGIGPKNYVKLGLDKVFTY